MKRVVFVILLLMTLKAVEIEGQVQGAWRPDQVVFNDPNARTIESPQPGIILFGETHYARVEVTSEEPRPASVDYLTASADELRAVWSPLNANAGTYEVSGDLLTVRPLVAKNPQVMAPGNYVVYTFRIQADTLWFTGQRNAAGPLQNSITIRAIRLE